ncbi:MAG: glycoside hydrolase family 108 protein [Sphingomicrobium sp.]
MVDRPPPQPVTVPAKEKAAVGGLMAVALAAILAAVYADEGGYVNNPNDPGGATRYGVTQKVARAAGYRGDMRNFPMHCSASAKVCSDDIYIRDYIVRPGWMPMVAIDPALADELVNTTVNMGALRPSRWFQMSLNELGAKVAVDGKVGPQSIAAYRSAQARYGKAPACVAMLDRLDLRQKAEYGRLVARNPKLKIFYKGWIAYRIGNVDRKQCGKGWA